MDAWEEWVDSTVNEGRFQGGEKRASKESLPRRSRMKHEWTQKLSRTFCRILVSLHVWPNLKWERRLGNEGPADKMTK